MKLMVPATHTHGVRMAKTARLLQRADQGRNAMDILKIAAESGMQVVLDGRIGREEYRSVVGSVQALQRFANALRISIAEEAQTLHGEFESCIAQTKVSV
jgi:hypothetical protein